MEVKKEHVDKVFDLAKLSLNFAKVNRMTHHEDGKRNESDTDHTFMLSLIACSLVDSFYKDRLDIGLISQYCTVHDLVEVYAGDTNSFLNITEEIKNDKIKREKKALEKIKSEFEPDFIWATSLIERYEKQENQESRFVKLVDKILPELLHILSNFSYILNSGKEKNYYIDFHKQKLENLQRLYLKEFPEIFEIYDEIWKRTMEKYKELI